jgi:hypothetical protein
MSSLVRPEFGPTLPELVGPRLRRLPRAARIALAVAAAAVATAVLALALGAGEEEQVVVAREGEPFNFIYRPPFERREPRAGEIVRVGSATEFMAVRPLRLEPFRGDVAGMLPVHAAREQIRLARELPGFMWRFDGRANVNRIQGYEFSYQYRPDGRLTYGRRIYLLPTPTSRVGVELVLEGRRSRTLPNVDAVGRNGPLKTSLRSFRFGTERP